MIRIPAPYRIVEVGDGNFRLDALDEHGAPCGSFNLGAGDADDLEVSASIEWAAMRHAAIDPDIVRAELTKTKLLAEQTSELRAGRKRNGRSTEAAAPASAHTPRTILEHWRTEGPIVHEPTGIEALDKATGGGLVYGSRIVLLGAPDAGKTALAVQIGCTYAERGLAVGFLAVDEEPGDVLQRVVQRAGYSRARCEKRDPADLDEIAIDVAHLPIRFYDGSFTIESAAADLAQYAKDTGTRAALFVDSLQTVRSSVEGDGASLRESVTARMMALRAVTSEFRMIGLATSEMARAGYRSHDPRERIADLAAGKESGSIEYQARVVLSLRNVPGESDLLELRLAKNKHGLVHRDGEQGIVLRIDRARQVITEVTDYTAPTADDREAARAARFTQQAHEDAAVVALVLADEPGLGKRSLLTRARMRAGCGTRRVDYACEVLGPALVELDGARRSKLCYLDGSRLSTEIMSLVPLPNRPKVAAARPPESECYRVLPSVTRRPGDTGFECYPPSPLRGRVTLNQCQSPEAPVLPDSSRYHSTGVSPEVQADESDNQDTDQEVGP